MMGKARRSKVVKVAREAASPTVAVEPLPPTESEERETEGTLTATQGMERDGEGDGEEERITNSVLSDSDSSPSLTVSLALSSANEMETDAAPETEVQTHSEADFVAPTQTEDETQRDTESESSPSPSLSLSTVVLYAAIKAHLSALPHAPECLAHTLAALDALTQRVLALTRRVLCEDDLHVPLRADELLSQLDHTMLSLCARVDVSLSVALQRLRDALAALSLRVKERESETHTLLNALLQRAQPTVHRGVQLVAPLWNRGVTLSHSAPLVAPLIDASRERVSVAHDALCEHCVWGPRVQRVESITRSLLDSVKTYCVPDTVQLLAL